MTRNLVIGNWKMNGSRRSGIQLSESIIDRLSATAMTGLEVAICPPFVHLADVADVLASGGDGGLEGHLSLGAQTLNEHNNGAFTGEVSAAMLIELGCRYVLVGHSERRNVLGETDTQVAEKFCAAEAGGLTPVLCVGESQEQRDTGDTFAVIDAQIRAVVALAGIDSLAAAVIAYEPVWAIGTGNTASPAQAQEVHAHIRACLGDVGKQMRLLYGGSVNADNAASLFAEQDIDGALVGGASLDAEQFVAICRAASCKIAPE